MLRTALVVACIALLPTESAAKPSDGCSFGVSKFYRQVFGRPPVYEHCCRKHDNDYARGGTADDRLRSDTKLAVCIAVTSPGEANIIFPAVRFGGQPFFPFDWRQYRRDPVTRWQYERDLPN